MEWVGWKFRRTPLCGPLHKMFCFMPFNTAMETDVGRSQRRFPSLMEAASPCRRNTLFIGRQQVCSPYGLANRRWDDDESDATVMGDLNNVVSRFSTSLSVPSSVPDDNTNGSVDEAGGSASGGNFGARARRSRGRPPGSKNKPKPQAIVERDSTNVLRCHVFKVEAGADVVAMIGGFVLRRKIGVSVLCASGTILSVKIRRPQGVVAAPHPGGHDVVFLSGDIVSLSGTFLPAMEAMPAMPAMPASLTVHVAAGKGQVTGGIVVGELVAAGPMVIVAATFGSFPCEWLPLPDVDEADAAAEQTAGRNYGGGGLGLSTLDLAMHFGAPPINLLLTGRQDTLGGPWGSPAPRRPPHPF